MGAIICSWFNSLGVSHPYENPDQVELTIDTENISVEEGVNYILRKPMFFPQLHTLMDPFLGRVPD